MDQLPIITEPAKSASALDAQQFVTLPVVAIADAVPVAAGTAAVFKITMLDSDGPLMVHVHSDSTDVPFDQDVTLTATVTQVSVPTDGAGGPYPEYFRLTLTSPDASSFVLRSIGTGTVVEHIEYTTYESGVYEGNTEIVYL